MGFYSGVFTSGKVGIILIYLMFMLLFSIPIWATLAQLIKNYNRQKNVEYVFTNYNIIINYENSVTKIKYKDITDVSVEEEKHSQKYGVESIVITKLDYANFVLHDLENAQSVSIRIKDLVYKSKNNMM